MAAACLAGLPTQRYRSSHRSRPHRLICRPAAAGRPYAVARRSQRYRSSPYKRGLPEGSQHRATEGTDPVPIVLFADQQQRDNPMRWPVVPPTGPPTGHRRATAKAINKSISIFQTTKNISFQFGKLIEETAFPEVRTYLAAGSSRSPAPRGGTGRVTCVRMR